MIRLSLPPAARRRAPAALFALASLYGSAVGAQLLADNFSSRVEQAARAQLARQGAAAGWLEPQFEVTLVASARPMPACRAALELVAQDVRVPSRMRFAAVCPGADGWRYELVVRAAITARVAVAREAVAAGQALAPEQLALERRDISNVPDSIGALDAAAGLSSRRALRAGELLRASLLAAPILVRRGAPVRIVARRAQIDVSTAGEALEAGARGAQVRVRNLASGNVIRARVLDADTVQPLDMPALIQLPE